MRADSQLTRANCCVSGLAPPRRLANTEELAGMCNETPERPRLEAIDQLEALGLSTYAARTFVGLVELGTGTAKSVSETVDVPRT